MGEGLAAVFWSLFQYVNWWLHAVVRWWTTQNAMLLVRGLPFLFVLLTTAYVAVAASYQSENYEQYSRGANDAIAAGDNKTARLYLERLARKSPQNYEVLYRLALVVDNLGDHQRAVTILKRIAPEDSPTYIPAHLLRAKLLLTRDLGRKQLQPALNQLFRCIELDSTNVQARGMLGEIYNQIGAWEDAEEHLQVAANESGVYLLPLAKSLAAQNKEQAAKRFGKRAQAYFQELVNENRNNHAARIGWAEATMFLEEFEEAVSILEAGILTADRPEFRRAMTRVCVTWADVIGDKTPESRNRQFQLLAEGLKHNPHEYLLFDRIMKVLKRGDKTTDEAHNLLINNIAAGQAVGLSHVLLGTFLGEKGDTNRALEHLQIAYRLDSSMYVVSNNLAWFLAHTDPPQLNEALAIITQLANQLPNNAAIRDTRGQILAKMERWDEALVDLEAALPAMRQNTQLHGALAEVYEHLKMPELAAEHRRIAELGKD